MQQPDRISDITPPAPPRRAVLAARAVVALLALGFPALLGAAGRPPVLKPSTGVAKKAAPLSPIPAASFKDETGADGTLAQTVKNARASVFVFLSVECPVSNRYAGRIRNLAEQGTKNGVSFFGVYPNPNESADAVAGSAKARGFRFPLVRTGAVRLARALGATTTPEAVVLDSRGRVRYRGRIDDNDDAGRVRSRDLAEAIAAVRGGKPVKRPETRAWGCAIRWPDTAEETSDADASARGPRITYAREIAPILNARCVSCHRAGEVGPMPLDSYQQARAWAGQIAEWTGDRRMPPWGADSHGEFYNERRLTDAEVQQFTDWAKTGAREGDAKSVPPAPVFPPPGAWKLGEPDAVITPSAPYDLPAEGKDLYRCFVIPTDFGGDKWVSSIEFQPDNKAVVHHINAFLDTSGTARRMDAADPGPGFINPKPGNPPFAQIAGTLGGWVPGHEPRPLPPGVANKLPKGADIIFEVHYHLTGKAERDRSRFGLRWASGPVTKQLQLADISAKEISIRPGDDHYVREASDFARADLTLLGVTPHMHLTGKAMRLTATFPDGTARTLVDVPRWNFQWQLSYRFREPVKIPSGTRLDVYAVFDNSDKNPQNPHKPPRAITLGESTDNEMCSMFLAYTLDKQDLTKPNYIISDE